MEFDIELQEIEKAVSECEKGLFDGKYAEEIIIQVQSIDDFTAKMVKTKEFAELFTKKICAMRFDTEKRCNRLKEKYLDDPEYSRISSITSSLMDRAEKCFMEFINNDPISEAISPGHLKRLENGTLGITQQQKDVILKLFEKS